MTDSHADAELIEETLAKVVHIKSHVDAAAEVGVDESAIRRWRKGDRARLRTRLRTALQLYLGVIPRAPLVSSKVPGVGTVLDQLISLIRTNMAEEAALRRVPPKRLIAIAQALALDWSSSDRRWLDAIRERLLKQGATALPITVKEDVRTASERADLADREAQIRLGVDPSLPRGNQRRLPRRIRGNRGG